MSLRSNAVPKWFVVLVLVLLAALPAFPQGFPSHDAVSWTGAEKGDAVFRDFDIVVQNAGHAGIYLGCNRYTDYKPLFINASGYTYGLRWPPLQHNPVKITDFDGFKGSNDYWGARSATSSWRQRNDVIFAALSQLGSPYAFVANIKDRSSTPNPLYPYEYLDPFYYYPSRGHATNGDGSFRCDGLVEYAYEQAGINGGQGFFAPLEEAAGINNTAGIAPERLFSRMSPTVVAPPQASDFVPASGSRVSGTVTISAFVTDRDWGSGVERTFFYVDEVEIGQDTHQEFVGGTYRKTWDSTSVANGTHTLKIRVDDQAGNWRTYSWQVTVDNQGVNPGGGTDNAGYVADLNVPDGTVFNPGQSFTKEWRIKNTGTSTWGSGYRWSFDGGTGMNGPGFIDVPAVSPSGTWDPAVSLRAPTTAGTYRGYWRMQAPSGTKFGTRVWVEIRVATTTASDTTPPVGAIDSPLPGASIGGVWRIAGWALDQGQNASGVRDVRVLLDGNDIGGAVYGDRRDDGNPGFHFDWNTSGSSPGAHNLKVRITDQAGNAATVGERTVYLSDITAPIGAIDSPLHGTTVSGVWRIAGWALDQGQNASGVKDVRLFVDDNDLGTVTYPVPREDGNPGFYLDWDTSKFPTGLRNLTLRITDNANNTKFIYQTVVVSRDWLLLRAVGESTVFRVGGGVRRAFNSANSFFDWGMDFANVQEVPRSDIDQYAWEPPIPHLITPDGGSLYYVQEGYRRHITNMDIFNGMGFSRDDVRSVSWDRFNSYPEWKPLGTIEPRLIVINGPRLPLPAQCYLGTEITAEFTVRNIASVGASVQMVLLSVRGPDGSICDFPSSGNFYLGPGQEYTYRTSRTLPLPGRYTYNASFMINNDEWHVALPSGLQADLPDSLEVLAGDPVTALQLTPSSVSGGASSEATVSLGGPAPSPGVLVAINNSNTALATVPASVMIPAGASSAKFMVTTNVPGNNASATITASSSTGSAQAVLSVQAPELTGLTLEPDSVETGGLARGTVLLSSVAPPGGATISLATSDASAATVPPSVTVPGGSSSASFTINAGSVSAQTLAVISATQGQAKKTVTLTVNAKANVHPDAIDDTASTPAGKAGIVSVLANDTDPDGDALSILSFTQPANGSVTDAGGGTLRYLPRAGYAGADSFTYTITDGKGGSDTASVSVTVTSPRLQVVNARASRNGDIVTVSFDLRNAGTAPAQDVRITRARLGSVSTNTTPLPGPFTISPGSTQTVKVTFVGVPSGSTQLSINGSHASGVFSSGQSITVP